MALSATRALPRAFPGRIASIRPVQELHAKAASPIVYRSLPGVQQPQWYLQTNTTNSNSSIATPFNAMSFRAFSSSSQESSADSGATSAESSFLQSIDLSHPNADDRQKLSKLIQEVVKTKANTGGMRVLVDRMLSLASPYVL